MTKILVVHNNERVRLDYLAPQLKQLIKDLGSEGQQASLEFVGPDVDLIRDNHALDSFSNRIRRAAVASWMFSLASKDPARLSRKERTVAYIRNFKHYLLSYTRSIKIEQEVLYAHAFCWRESVRLDEPIIVLESDAVLHEHTRRWLLKLLVYLQTSYGPKDKYYVDLAGGCHRDEIANSWCFESKHGCVSFDLANEPKLTVHSLPRLVTNTVGGYLLSSCLAADFLEFVQKSRPMLPPDWMINFFANKRENDRTAVCLHTTPTLFTQGSFSGEYRSTIDPSSRGP